MSLVLVVAAGLMIRSFVELGRVRPGIDPHGLLTLDVALPQTRYPTDQAGRAFFRTLLDRLSALPGVRAAGVGDPLPYGQGGSQAGVTLEGVPEAVPGENPLLDATVVSGDYFRAMGIPLLRGRRFADADNEGAPRVVLVSDALVRRFWPGLDPIGRTIDIDGREYQIVGQAKAIGTVFGQAAVGPIPGRTPVPAHATSAAMALIVLPRRSGQPAAGAPRPRSPFVMSTYYVCNAREAEADFIVKTLLGPILNQRVKDRKIDSWAWDEHLMGGKYRRLLVVDGASAKALLQHWGTLPGDMQKADPDMSRRFYEICNSHSDYIWEISQ